MATYARACDEGQPLGCFLHGDAVAAREPAAARRAFERSCAHAEGRGLGCERLEGLLREGRGGPVDEAGADEARGRACEMGSVDACQRLVSEAMQSPQ